MQNDQQISQQEHGGRSENVKKSKVILNNQLVRQQIRIVDETLERVEKYT